MAGSRAPGRCHGCAGAGAAPGSGGFANAGRRQEAAGAETDACGVRAGPDRAAAIGVIHSAGRRERMIVCKTLVGR